MSPATRLGAPTYPTRVLEVVGNAIVGGTERHVEGLVRFLPRDRFEVTCVAPFESPFTTALRDLGCAVFVVPMGTPMGADPPWSAIPLVVNLLREHHIDVVHAHLISAHLVGGLAGHLTGTPVLTTVHEQQITDTLLTSARLIGSHLLAVCQKTYLQGLALGIPTDQISLIPNGVDTETFLPGAGGAAFRVHLGVPRAAPLVGFVGRLSPEKGPDQFVRVAQQVRRRRPDVHFALVGEGPEEPSLRQAVRAMDLVDRVHFAGVVMDMSTVYAAFDVVAQTSHTEGMPLVLLEAMACARPVVAMGVGGVDEVVQSGVTGILVRAGDCPAAAAAILGLLARPDQMRRMGQAGRARAQKHFPLHHAVPRIGELLRGLAARSAPSRSPLQALRRTVPAPGPPNGTGDTGRHGTRRRDSGAVP